MLSCFFCSLKYNKIENYIIFKEVEKKIWPKLQRIFLLFPKNCHLALKIWIWDPGSRKKPIPDPGSGGQKGTGTRIRIRNVQ